MALYNLDWISVNDSLPNKSENCSFYDVWVCYKNDTIDQSYGYTKGVYDCNSQSFSLEDRPGLYFKKDNFRNHSTCIQIMAWQPICPISKKILNQFYRSKRK